MGLLHPHIVEVLLPSFAGVARWCLPAASLSQRRLKGFLRPYLGELRHQWLVVEDSGGRSCSFGNQIVDGVVSSPPHRLACKETRDSLPTERFSCCEKVACVIIALVIYPHYWSVACCGTMGCQHVVGPRSSKLAEPTPRRAVCVDETPIYHVNEETWVIIVGELL